LELREVLLHALAGDRVKPGKGALVTRHTVLGQQHSISFLVAEDNTVKQRLISRLLEERGHTVVVAQIGEEALQALQKQSFEVVLDGQTPEMDGFEVTKKSAEQKRPAAIMCPSSR
jgi:CheY-like chemotaxis protein